ncbi:hypothetical protein QE152_g27817 [Popillia japonica]|uniref:Uncharacterized protein n=1 Tax=Popillia japonica TaxID=7064 RepID=A0AAW1JK41_POPJA
MKSSPAVMPFLSFAVLDSTSPSVIRPSHDEHQLNKNGGEVMLCRYVRENCKANPLTMSADSLTSVPFRCMCPGIRSAQDSFTNFQEASGFVRILDQIRCWRVF